MRIEANPQLYKPYFQIFRVFILILFFLLNANNIRESNFFLSTNIIREKKIQFRERENKF